MNDLSRSRQYNAEKLEAIKNRLNASNIIRNDFFSQSLYKAPKSQSYYTTTMQPTMQPMTTVTSVPTVHYDDLKNRVQREVNAGLNLETEKRELELMIDDQADAQNRMRMEYEKEIDTFNARIDHINQLIEDLNREIDEKGDQESKKENINTELEGEISEVIEENKLLKTELQRLGEKTNLKMTEMQNKMQSGLADLEVLKEKHGAELEKMNNSSADKIKRMEDDFNKKITLINDKYNQMLLNKQNAESELLRLQDAKKRADIELENKIKLIKEQYYDEQYNQFKGMMKIYQNRLRTAIENKDQMTKKQERLMKESDELEHDVNDNEENLLTENRTLQADIASLKEDIGSLQREVEGHKTQNFTVESDSQRLTSEIQRAKFQFKQIADNGKYKIKESVDKYRYELEDQQNKAEHAKARTKELEDELEGLRAQYRAQEKQNQRILDNMKSKLNQNIFQTINEYKEMNMNSSQDQQMRVKDKSYMSYYVN